MVESTALRQPQRERIRPRSARQATEQRVRRKARAGYSGLLQFCAILTVALFGVMLYVTLTARLTSLNYAVAKAQIERTALQAQTARLDDQLAQLKSDDRLASVAAKLHMQDPQQFAQVSLPAPVHEAAPSRLAFFAGLAGIFRAK